MPKQNTMLWTGKVRLDVRNGRFVKYTNNRINSAENYAWYLDCKHSALGEIYSTKNCAFPIDAYWTFYFKEATRQAGGGRSRSCVKLDAPSISIQAKYNILPRTTAHIFSRVTTFSLSVLCFRVMALRSVISDLEDEKTSHSRTFSCKCRVFRVAIKPQNILPVTLNSSQYSTSRFKY